MTSRTTNIAAQSTQTYDSITIRTLRRDDYPALIELVRHAWYADEDERASRLGAQADWEHCLARTTTAFVAEADGEPVGMILGRVDARDTRGPWNAHYRRYLSLLPQQLLSADGRENVAYLMGIHAIERRLIRMSGHYLPAEVVLFVTAPQTRGLGLGARLFDTLLQSFREQGVHDYFLFTDTTCNFGFYEHRGLTRAAEITRRRNNAAPGEPNTESFYLYEGRA